MYYHIFWMTAGDVNVGVTSIGVVLFFRDISERRQAEQSVKESEQHLAKELNAARKLQQVSTLLCN